MGGFVAEIVTNALLQTRFCVMRRKKKMNDKLFKINVLITVFDFFLCGMGVAAFAVGAWLFSKWWIALFALIPLGLYSNHGIVVETDIQQSKIDALKPQKEEADDD